MLGSSSIASRNVATGLKVAAMLAVALMAYFLDSGGAVRPSGTLGLRLQGQIERIAVAAGGKVSGDACTMMGNVNLGVTCSVEGLDASKLAEALTSQGWLPQPEKSSDSAVQLGMFVQGNYVLLFEGMDNEGRRILTARARR